MYHSVDLAFVCAWDSRADGVALAFPAVFSAPATTDAGFDKSV